MKKIILAVMLLPLLSVAQTSSTATNDKAAGMKFEHGLSWKEIQAKAKAENKFIIMDCYTTWCGPCKFMDANIFPLKETGDFFNANYINVKVQFDSTAGDNEEVKAWRNDMKEIQKLYTINAYPTYLMFDPNGQIVHRSVGSTENAKLFIAKGQDGLTPEKQYYTQLRKYEKGDKEPEFLRKVATMAKAGFDYKNAEKISNEYLATQTNLFTKENLAFVEMFTSKSTDKGFALLTENPEKVNDILGKGRAEQKIMAIVMQEEAYPVIFKRGTKDAPAPVPDFAALGEKLSQKYPKYGEEITAKSKVFYYQSKNDWNNFQTEIVAYMKKYGDKVSPAELNSYAWTVFANCKDMTCVTEALEWSKRSFKDKANPSFMDTYANILHKLGKTDEAIGWLQKAITLAGENEKKTYQDTIDKMKKGEKTWSEK
jgi:thioredoxin-related protein